MGAQRMRLILANNFQCLLNVYPLIYILKKYVQNRCRFVIKFIIYYETSLRLSSFEYMMNYYNKWMHSVRLSFKFY
jgi:hypothetical protein